MTNFNKTAETEKLRDYANSVFGEYFRRIIKNNIDKNDETNIIIKNSKAVYKIMDSEVLKCETLRDFEELEKQITDYKDCLKEIMNRGDFHQP